MNFTGDDDDCRPDDEQRDDHGRTLAGQGARTVQNFTDYVEAGHYDGTIFHRVIKGFMIQGGGYTAELKEKRTRPPVPLEAKAPNRKYTVAMARTNDPNSATSQFFINTADNGFLDPGARDAGYTVFGVVTRGQDVVDKIAALAKDNRGGAFSDLTKPVVVIETATLAK